MSGTVIIIGDTKKIVLTLESDSVQTIITSPPYYGLRDYGADGQIGLEPTPQEYVDGLVVVFRECRRVLKSNGTFWLNIGDSYAANRTYQVSQTKVPAGCKPKDLIGIPWMLAFALREDGWYLRSDIIWHKPNSMPESIRDRPGSSYEHMFLFAKSEHYAYDAEAVKIPSLNAGTVISLGNKSFSKRQADGAGVEASGNGLAETYTVKDKKNLRNLWSIDQDEYTQFLHWKSQQDKDNNLDDVWSITTKPFREAHFATFPPDLVIPCIRAGSQLDEVVFDPFGGSGTTSMVANHLGRNSIMLEINPIYADMAKTRIMNSGISDVVLKDRTIQDDVFEASTR